MWYLVVILWSQNLLSPGISQRLVCTVCGVNITGDIQIFAQISIFLYKTKIVEIWTKFFVSPVILKAQKKADHILEMPRLGVFCDNKLLNCIVEIRPANQCRKLFQSSKTSFNSLIVMFCGTPCNVVKGNRKWLRSWKWKETGKFFHYYAWRLKGSRPPFKKEGQCPIYNLWKLYYHVEPWQVYNSNNYAIVFEARNAQVTFLGEKTNEVNQFLLSRHK